jgi:hypothetical protein
VAGGKVNPSSGRDDGASGNIFMELIVCGFSSIYNLRAFFKTCKQNYQNL